MNAEENTKTNRAEIEQSGESSFDKAVWLVLGSFISSAFGIAFFMWQRGRQAKDHFIVTLSQLEGELQRSKDVPVFHQSSLPRMEEAVFRLRPFLHKTGASDLSRIWNLYREALPAVQEKIDGDETDQRIYPYFDEKMPKTKRELVEWFHRKFTAIAMRSSEQMPRLTACLSLLIIACLSRAAQSLSGHLSLSLGR